MGRQGPWCKAGARLAGTWLFLSRFVFQQSLCSSLLLFGSFFLGRVLKNQIYDSQWTCLGSSTWTRRSLPAEAPGTLTVVPGPAPARGGAEGARGEAGVGAGQAHGGRGGREQGGHGQLQQRDVVGAQILAPQGVLENLGTRGGGSSSSRGDGRGAGAQKGTQMELQTESLEAGV